MTCPAARRRFLTRSLAIATVATVRPALAATVARSARNADDADPRVTVERDGSGAIVVQAQAVVLASAEKAFATLTDYDRLGDFIPDLAASTTLKREGGSALIEQRGKASFGPFERQFTLRLSVEESPAAWVQARLAGGSDFKRFEARYELTSLANDVTRLEYRATLEPTAGVPPLVGVPVMRTLIRRQFAAMVGEIARRA